MIRLIIFDVGGVIDTFYESQYVRYLTKKLQLDPSRFMKALIPLVNRMEVGKITLAQLKKSMSTQFHVKENDLEWDVSFKRMNRVNKNVIKLIGRLSKHYRIAILTNVSRSRHIMKMEDYLENVKYDMMFTSCYLKMAKPDHRIYRYVLKKMNSKPGETVFIDNLKRNTDGAKEIGIKTIQFVGYKDLVNRLKKLGVRW